MDLQIQNWNTFLNLGLKVLSCHIKGLKSVAIYAFSSGKFLDFIKYLTNIMSGRRYRKEGCRRVRRSQSENEKVLSDQIRGSVEGKLLSDLC